MPKVAAENEETRDAWNGPLFDRFVDFRHVVVGGIADFGTEAMRRHPPGEGDKVIDLGCGFGDTTQQLAGLVGPRGHAYGVDIAERFIDASREEAAAAAVQNVSFDVADIEATTFEGPYDYAFSRFGVMFFAGPVAALRNVRAAMKPAAKLVMVVWRQKPDNDWLYRGELLVKNYLEKNEDSDEPTCGPGPFSMAGADTTSDILLAAGFEDVQFERVDQLFKMGDTVEEAVALVTAIGPAGEVLRLAGDDADGLRPRILTDLRDGLAEFQRDDGVWAPASVWVISATNPG